MADSRASAPTGSNNPFRRKSTYAPDAASSAAVTVDPVFEPSSVTLDPPLLQSTTSNFLRQHLQALPQTHEPPPSTTFQKPKVVKKVRVQSPPPSSPESESGGPRGYPAYGYGHDESESSSDDEEAAEDPFRAAVPPLGVIGHANYSVPTSAPSHSSLPPPNPFKKTLEDIEHGSSDVPHIPGAAVGGKGSLDVDAFKRLLMTGQAEDPRAVPLPTVSTPGASNTSSQAADAASVTDASSVSRQSIFEASLVQETPRTSHEISEAEGEDDRLGLLSNPQAKTHQTVSTLRKKPPPPSSRHGKVIKVDLSKDNTNGPGMDGILLTSSSASQRIGPSSPGGSSASSRRWPDTPSDVNKPLPPAPTRRSMDEGGESIFDRESAGKVPEQIDVEADADAIPTPRPPTPPNASHAAITTPNPPDPRKPAPPPRRNPHSRSESKLLAPKAAPALHTLSTFTEEPLSGQRRSSQDSTRSRSSSLRVAIHAPAPPPPRRPNHASRPSFTSLSGGSLTNITSTSAVSLATSPAPSDIEHPPLPSPVPLVTSPEPVATTSWPAPVHTASFPSATAPPPPTARPKLSPPPLPPARNTSVRSSGGRPTSVRSIDATSRRIKENEGSISTAAPPPPPPPKRSRAGSGRDRGALLGRPVTEEPDRTVPMDGAEEKAADHILADLEALQREVDALRGKYEKKAGDPGA